MFQVSRPYLGFWPDPKHFIVLKNIIYIYNKKKKKMCCGHKTYGSILSFRYIKCLYSNEIEEFLGHCLAYSWR